MSFPWLACWRFLTRKPQRFVQLSRRTRASWVRPRLEIFEDRTLPSCTINWGRQFGGDWSEASNWSPQRLPNSTDDVCISDRVLSAVTHSVGTDTIHSLVSGQNFNLAGGTLNVTTTVQVAPVFTLFGGTLSGATVVAGTTLVGQTGILSGVTLAGPLDMASGVSNVITVVGGLLLNSTLTLGGNIIGHSGKLLFQGSQTIAGTGTVVFGVDANNEMAIDAGNTLTLAAGLTLRTAPGGYGIVNGPGNVVNQAAILATAGNFVMAGPNWKNQGSIRAANGGEIAIRTTVATSEIGTLAHSDADGSRISIFGTIFDDNAPLRLDAATGSYDLQGGTLFDVTVDVTGSASLRAVAGTLLGVTVNGNLDLSIGSEPVVIQIGLTLNNVITTVRKNLIFTGAGLYGNGTLRLASSTISATDQNDSPFLISPEIKIHAVEGTNGITATGIGIMNRGTIIAESRGTSLTLSASTWTNQGTLQAENGGRLIGLAGSTNVVAGVLRGGTWNVLGDSTLELDSVPITATAVSILLDGPQSHFTRDGAGTNALTGLATIQATGAFTIRNGQNFTTVADFNNRGTLVVGVGCTFVVTGHLVNVDSRFNVLSGGTYVIGGTFEFPDGNIDHVNSSSSTSVVLDGPASQILNSTSHHDALANLSSIDGRADSLTIRNGRNFTTAGAFIDYGILTIGLGSTFTVTGNLTNFRDQTLSFIKIVVAGTLKFPNADIRTNAAILILDGPAATVLDLANRNALANLATNSGNLVLQSGANFTTAGAFSNRGYLGVGAGSTFYAPALTNFSNRTLTGGNFQITGILKFTGADIATNAAQINLGGPGAAIVDEMNRDALANLNLNDTTGVFEIGPGRTFNPPTIFQNRGTLTIDVGAVLNLIPGDSITGAGTLDLPGGLVHLSGSSGSAIISNRYIGGITQVDQGTTLVLHGELFGINGGRLWDGTYLLAGTLVLPGYTTIGENQTKIVLDGPGSAIRNENGADALAHLTALSSLGNLVILNGRTFTTQDPFRNQSGVLTIGLNSSFTAAAGYSSLGGRIEIAAGGNVYLPGLVFIRGNITGDGTVTIPTGGYWNWSGGMFGRGQTLVAAGATVVMDPGNSLCLDGGWQLRNSGTVTGGYGIQGLFCIGRKATVVNERSGLIDITSDGDFGNAPYSRVDFINDGTLRKSGGSGRTIFDEGVTFRNNGTLDVRTGTIFIRGHFTNYDVHTGTLSGGTYNLAGTLRFSGANIRENAAQIALNNPTAMIVDESGANALAHLAVNQAGASLTVQGGRTLAVIGAFTNAGTLTVTGGSSLIASGGYIQTAGATILAGGTLGAGDPIKVDAGTLSGFGMLNADVSNLDTVDVRGGRLMVQRSFANAGAVTIEADGMLTVGTDYVQTDGLTVLAGGVLSAGGLVDVEGGSLTGSGTVGSNVWNAALIDVGGGGATGVLTVTGDYTQTPDGVLNMEIGGTDPSGGFDQLHIRGAALLDGTLNVSLLGAFQPQAGDNFPIMTFGSVTGVFAVYNGLDLGGGLFLLPLYGDTSLTLVTIPSGSPGRPGGNTPENGTEDASNRVNAFVQAVHLQAQDQPTGFMAFPVQLSGIFRAGFRDRLFADSPDFGWARFSLPEWPVV